MSEDEMKSNNENNSTDGPLKEPEISDESDNEPIAKPNVKKGAAKRKGKTLEPIAKRKKSCICARASHQIKCLKCKKCFVGRIFEKCPVHTKTEKLMDAEFCFYCGQYALIKLSEEADYSGSDCDEEFDDMDTTSDEFDSENDETDSESDRTHVDIPSSDSDGDD
ncbi:Hypothetical predicted protein [Drosophila guanche]|uniref:Uncharacterized protein n=1 Tax=Drosophila guanche TaxID=7266 RepID=A0A3B0JCF5_DROGU|nr:Hypothetical predicted protein [Drosophila guanche]